MEIPYALYNALFPVSLLAGVFCGAVYDIFRLFRAFIPHGKLIVFICDIVYCLFTGTVLTVLYYNYSDGHVRLYAVLGLAAGFAAYYFTVGRLTVFAARSLKKAVSALARKTAARVMSVIGPLYRKAFSAYTAAITVRRSKRGFGL